MTVSGRKSPRNGAATVAAASGLPRVAPPPVPVAAARAARRQRRLVLGYAMPSRHRCRGQDACRPRLVQAARASSACLGESGVSLLGVRIVQLDCSGSTCWNAVVRDGRKRGKRAVKQCGRWGWRKLDIHCPRVGPGGTAEHELEIHPILRLARCPRDGTAQSACESVTRRLTLTYLFKRALVVISAVARRQVGVADLHTRV